MKVPLYDSKKIVRLKHFRFCAQHFAWLLAMQADKDLANLPLEIDSDDRYRKFIPIHAINLESDFLIRSINLNAS